ncbi:AAA family ATPase [Portibacter lacus]|uniref:ATPase AAA n=1 Tax=Portibacter lacus TaxID=1099794 RepID=A0AA37WEL4_9BACT|nr:MoxR family ATPase [Portibacter lacus]GLR17517.1 ATPase AAA [Portibacter lacus]
MISKEKVNGLIAKTDELRENIHKVIIGQDDVITQLLVGLIAGGHVLLEGVPGLAKTLMVKTLADAVDGSFSRIQFTPDLMPSDILGTEILQTDKQGNKFFEYTPGPVFANIVLADEINRTPPKTQAALLELMQEYSVTYAGKKYPLPDPFFLLATQNPIEQSGTFPLPEAQVDRFLLYVKVNYPTAAEEEEILLATTGSKKSRVEAVFHKEEVRQLQELCRQVSIDRGLITQVSNWIRNTRPEDSSNQMIKDFVDWGAGPRAGQSLILAAKAHALLSGRYAVIPEDIKAMFIPALQHRLLLNFKAVSEKVNVQDILKDLMHGS